MTLRVRMAAVAAAAVAVVAIALVAGSYAAMRAELRNEIDRALVDRAGAFADGPPLDGRDGHGNGPRPPAFGGAPGSVQRVAPDGTTSLPAGETAKLPVDAATRSIAAAGAGTSFRDATVEGVHLRIYARGVGTDGAIQVARPLTEVDSALDRLLAVLAALAAAGVAIAAGLGAVVARTALAPVVRFTRRTEALAGSPDLSLRLEEEGRDELTRLARSFNRTLDALERSVDAQRHLVADASHELRTPISSLRANIQVLEHADRLPPEDRAALRADIVAELDELTSLVGDVVELARGNGPAEHVDDVRLDRVAADLVERFRRRAGDAVRFEAALEESVVEGEPERIARAVSNLLDNARKWSPAGGVVEVAVRDGVLTVRDHGPGIPAEDVDRVFDRFYRARAARGTTGSGLGLAIVRQAAESHGGWVRAANAPDGGAVLTACFVPGRADADGARPA